MQTASVKLLPVWGVCGILTTLSPSHEAAAYWLHMKSTYESSQPLGIFSGLVGQVR